MTAEHQLHPNPDVYDMLRAANARAEAAEAERDRLRRWKDEALPVIGGLQELGRALGVGLGKRITGLEAVEAAERLKAERDTLDALRKEALNQRDVAERRLAAVEALIPAECWVLRIPLTGPQCTDMIGGGVLGGVKWTEDMCCLPCRLRAALSNPTALDALIARERAAALREAASDIVADCTNQPGPCICVARDWLRDRADALTAEAER